MPSCTAGIPPREVSSLKREKGGSEELLEGNMAPPGACFICTQKARPVIGDVRAAVEVWSMRREIRDTKRAERCCCNVTKIVNAGALAYLLECTGV